MDVIDKINAELSKIGITGSEMCRALGFSSGVYSQWNTKKTKPSKKAIKLVAEFLKISVDYLLGVESEEKEKPAPISESELNESLINSLVSLTPEELLQVDAFVQGLKAARKV